MTSGLVKLQTSTATGEDLWFSFGTSPYLIWLGFRNFDDPYHHRSSSCQPSHVCIGRPTYMYHVISMSQPAVQSFAIESWSETGQRTAELAIPNIWRVPSEQFLLSYVYGITPDCYLLRRTVQTGHVRGQLWESLRATECYLAPGCLAGLGIFHQRWNRSLWGSALSLSTCAICYLSGTSYIMYSVCISTLFEWTF